MGTPGRVVEDDRVVRGAQPFVADVAVHIDTELPLVRHHRGARRQPRRRNLLIAESVPLDPQIDSGSATVFVPVDLDGHRGVRRERDAVTPEGTGLILPPVHHGLPGAGVHLDPDPVVGQRSQRVVPSRRHREVTRPPGHEVVRLEPLRSTTGTKIQVHHRIPARQHQPRRIGGRRIKIVGI
ncbi:hypothetical protein SDC9_90739 [bioreactor metagenome]|uniref:Uncharacterized protein n=1 Tax=bioreactor metagenome TaxID=1076179 RepID=A0A644ZVY0_9ZZZZ